MGTSFLFDRKVIGHRRSGLSCGLPAFLQSHYVNVLAERLTFITRRFKKALIIGLPPGFYSLLFEQYDEKPLIYSLCLGKMFQAQDLQIIGDDEIFPFKSQFFDLIVSFFHLHCVNDLPGSLSQLKQCLQADGLFLGALAGGTTLTELRQSFEQAELQLKGGVHPRVSPMIQLKDAGALLQRAGFALPVVDDEVLKILYNHPLDVMTDLKRCGQTNSLVQRPQTFTSRGVINKMMSIYKEKYSIENHVSATFNALFLSGWAPCETQPKPLKQGSAQYHLEKIL